MSDSPLFSPELEGLLREAAADPRSVLLRVPRPRSARGLLERQEPFGRKPSGVSLIDRHLLEVHRDELAYVLLEACRVRLFSDANLTLSVHRVRTTVEDWEIEDQDDWALRAEPIAHSLEIGCPGLEGLELLSSCLDSRRSMPASITQLARAALRLQPTPKARAWVVFDLRLQGRYSDSIRMAGQELSGHVAPGLSASLLEYRATSQASLGQFGPAAEDAWKAHLEDPDHVSALVNAMHFAILAEDADRAQAAGSALDELVASATPGLEEQLRVFELTKQAGRVPSSDTTRTIARTLLEKAGPLARKVLHVHS